MSDEKVGPITQDVREIIKRIKSEPEEERERRIEKAQEKEAERQKGRPPGFNWRDIEIA